MASKKLWNTIILVWFVLGMALADPSHVSAQGQPQIRIEQIDFASYPKVKVYVSALDAQGLPIAGLTPDSFHLAEDGKPAGGLETASIQNNTQALALAIAVDTSESLNSFAKPTPLDNSINAVNLFLGKLASQDQVTLLSFSDTVNIIQDWTGNKADAQAAVETLSAKGNTALYDAVIKAVDQLKNRSERRALILLTDGAESGASKYTLEQAIDEAVRWSIQIYGIGFGNVQSAPLSELSERTGGAIQIKPDSTALDSSFNGILTILRSQYLLTYTSSLPGDGQEHTFTASMDYQGGHFEVTRKAVLPTAQIKISFPDLNPDQVITGTVHLAPELSGPLPVTLFEIKLDGSSLASITSAPFEFDWDTTRVKNGAHELQVSSADAAGNSGILKIPVNIQNNNTPVKISFADLQDSQTVRGNISIKPQFESAGPMSRLEVKLDGQPLVALSTSPFEMVWDSSKVTAGLHVLDFHAVDSLDNYGDLELKLNVENPVTIEIPTLADGDTVSGNVIIEPQVVSAASLTKVALSIDGNPNPVDSQSQAPFKFTWDSSSVAAGTHTLTISATDANQFTATKSVKVIVAVQHSNTILWFGLIVVIAASLMLIPLGLSRRRRMVAAASKNLKAVESGPVAVQPGASRAILREVEGLSPGQVWPLQGDEIRLGRKRDENDVPLQGLSASRRHAVIRCQNDQYILLSLKPENQVTVNGQPVSQWSLQPGDKIQLGQSIFMFERY
jgi:VWFA-related protein